MTVIISAKLSELNLRQLLQLQHMLGREADEIREKRQHLNLLIARRLASGENEATMRPVEAAQETIAQDDVGQVDAVFEGQTLEVKAEAQKG